MKYIRDCIEVRLEEWSWKREYGDSVPNRPFCWPGSFIVDRSLTDEVYGPIEGYGLPEFSFTDLYPASHLQPK